MQTNNVLYLNATPIQKVERNLMENIITNNVPFSTFDNNEVDILSSIQYENFDNKISDISLSKNAAAFNYRQSGIKKSDISISKQYNLVQDNSMNPTARDRNVKSTDLATNQETHTEKYPSRRLSMLRGINKNLQNETICLSMDETVQNRPQTQTDNCKLSAKNNLPFNQEHFKKPENYSNEVCFILS